MFWNSLVNSPKLFLIYFKCFNYLLNCAFDYYLNYMLWNAWKYALNICVYSSFIGESLLIDGSNWAVNLQYDSVGFKVWPSKDRFSLKNNFHSLKASHYSQEHLREYFRFYTTHSLHEKVLKEPSAVADRQLKMVERTLIIGLKILFENKKFSFMCELNLLPQLPAIYLK